MDLRRMLVETGLLPGGAILDDRYQILDRHAVGGVAEIYEARQLDLDIPVAIKVVARRKIGPRTLANHEQRLRLEAETAARIRHPNAIGVRSYSPNMTVRLDAVTAELDRPYMAMDLLEGHPLTVELARGGPIAPARALKLALGVLDALAMAHRLGIVHKDLKPDNLFLTHPGLWREALIVLDFGVARLGASRTLSGELPLTPQYVAPEYIENHEVTPAVDVYQMGLIITEMFTGAEVVGFDRPIDCIDAHISGQLDIPEWLKSSPLGPLLRSSLARDPGERIPNAGIFFKVLSRIDPGDITPPAGTVDLPVHGERRTIIEDGERE